jgi:putative ABC transport system ATP-binding protein
MAGVSYAWPGKNAFSLAISDFNVNRGERLLLIGPSGSGKSTFLSLLAGIVKPDVGHVEILGTDTSSLTSAARDHFRAEHFGIIFQMFNLLPYGSVIDNVVLPLNFAAGRRQRATQNLSRTDEALRLLKALGLNADDFAGMPASSLSVGQQQRVAAARALIGRPDIIVADEPTSSLDSGRQAAFLDVLFQEAQASGITIILVSHDTALGQHFDRVVSLGDIATGSRRAAS